MDGWPGGFWGKFQPESENGGPPQWHPLADHCLDVAACFLALLEVALPRRRLARLGGLDDLDPTQRERLAVLALLHDLGKFNLGFQYKVIPEAQRPAHLRPAGHVYESEALLCHPTLRVRAATAIGWVDLARWAEHPHTVESLLLAAISHHGAPVVFNAAADRLNTRVWAPHKGLDPLAGIAELATRARNILTRAFQTEGPPLPERPAFQHGFAGLVMLADWLGSNRAWFPYAKPGDGERWDFAREQAGIALRDVGLDVSIARSRVAPSLLAFEQLFDGHPPRPMQAAVQRLPLPLGPCVAVLESETGSGKTEAAVYHYLRLMRAGAVDSLYFALPTRTAATQLYGRVQRAVQRAFGPDAPPVVQAVPGQVQVDAHALPAPHHLWGDEPGDRTRYRSWAGENPKRFLGAAVAVGTVDQVLLAILRVKHAHLRLAALSRSLLVVDEVHASDPYMTGLLRALLAAHQEAGGHALLMSATLGSVSRCAYLGLPAMPFAQAEAEPYPVLWYRSGEHHEQHKPERAHENPPAKTVAMEALAWLDDPQRVATHALEQARRGARVLVLRNTVANALATQQALEAAAGGDESCLFRCNDIVTLHHSRFAREDRVLLDNALAACVGKDTPARPVVVVSTQTIQQSLDVDFDLLLTDLCPADVLLQRIGRLHRHERERPTGFESPTCSVLVPDARCLTPFIAKGRGGLGGLIYPDVRILEATWRLVEREPAWALPAMNRRLVEQATHPEALGAVAAELGPKWQAHGNEMQGQWIAQGLLAGLNALELEQPFGELSFPEGIKEKVATRLGADDRLAEFPGGVSGPFGQPVFSLRIPGHLCRKAPADCEATPEAQYLVGFRFTFGPHRFVYDRLGLREDEL